MKGGCPVNIDICNLSTVDVSSRLQWQNMYFNSGEDTHAHKKNTHALSRTAKLSRHKALCVPPSTRLFHFCTKGKKKKNQQGSCVYCKAAHGAMLAKQLTAVAI